MSNPLDLQNQVKQLKKKLSTSLSANSSLDIDLKKQSTMMTKFIIKLSQTTKGVDVLLDNKLAKLRTLFTKKATLEEVELLINDISLLLQKYSTTNEQTIREMHQQFHNSGTTLQKVKGLPDELRRNLRTLIAKNEDHKDALIQYIPTFSSLLSLYEIALKTKSNGSEAPLLAQSNNPTPANETPLSSTFIKRFLKALDNLSLSEKHASQITKIKSDLDISMSNDKLIESVLTAFDVLVQDLLQEKNTAKVFLHTLSETLSSVQTIVKTTLSQCDSTSEQQNEINEQLQAQITEMSKGLDSAASLADIKVDINNKLQLIAGSIEKKISLEHNQQKSLAQQLHQMTEKVNHLEAQGVLFEKSIQEQKAKSMQDALTKLGNRAAFDDYFSKKMVKFHQSNFELAIAVLDLDDFKRINDTYGHTAGDKTLQVIAKTLQKVIADDAFICRYGGEEFVLIFSNINKTTVLEKLNNLRQRIATLPFKFKNNKVSITTSIGVTHVKDGDNIHLAFDRADSGLYKAKAKGKNTVIYI